jgi:hypothetical protein
MNCIRVKMNVVLMIKTFFYYAHRSNKKCIMTNFYTVNNARKEKIKEYENLIWYYIEILIRKY